MRERYSYELPKWMKLLGVKRINTDSVDFKWGYFAPRPALELVLNRGTYFDCRYAINFALGWGKFMIYLPFKTKLEEGCDMPRYGFAVHNNTLWFYKGGDYDEGQCQNQWITWDLPYFSWKFEGHWILNKSKQWSLVESGSYQYRKDSAYVEVHPFTYILKNGTIQERTATCTIEKRKWYRKWFPFLTMTRQVIDIEFSDEVGERSGTWKGGTIGMSYDLRSDESIAECLDRLQKDPSRI
jgi:hypothetical protein